MVVFGLVLLVVALAVIAYMWLATRGMDPAQISYGFLNVDVTPFWMFLAGGITLAVATCGLWLMAVGARSRARRAKEVRELRRQVQTNSSQGTGKGGASSSTSGSTSSAGRTSSAGGTSSGTTSAPKSDPILPRPGGSGTHGGSGTTGGTSRKSSLDVDR